MNNSPFQEENDPRYKEEVSLEYFNTFCYQIINLAKKGKKLTNIDSKLYYKLRHNLFKTYVLQNMGFMSSQEKPFSFFSELGLDSHRTPDFLIQVQDHFLLIEFTISNNLNSVLKNKGFFSKYREEINNSLIPISEYYLYLTLDSDCQDCIDMISSISITQNIELHSSFKDEIEDVLNTIKSVTSYFNDFCPEILLMNNDSLSVVFNNNILEVNSPFNEYHQLKGRATVKSTRIKGLINRFSKKLLFSLRRKPSNGLYKISINFVSSNCYITEDFDGLSKDTLNNMLDMNLIDVSKAVKILGDFYKESDIFEDIQDNLLDPIDRENDSQLVVDYQSYENNFINHCFKDNMKTVSDCLIDNQRSRINEVYHNQYMKLLNNNNVITYKSSPFIFYPCDVLKKGSFKIELETGADIVDILIKAAISKNVTQNKIINRELDYDAMMNMNRMIYNMGKALKKDFTDFRDVIRLRKDKFDKLLLNEPRYQPFVEFRNLRSNYRNIVSEETRLAYSNRLRLNLNLNDRWLRETEHFKQSKNVHKICSDMDYRSVKNNYQSFLVELFESNKAEIDDNVLSDTFPLGKSLKDNCNQMYDLLHENEKIFKKTLLGHSTLLISQISYSLMYYSNIKLNKDDFVFDNLGYQNVLLMVKGGKKIRSTKCSRFFRLLIPITEAQSRIVSSITNKIFIKNDQKYLLTPWRVLRISYLKKGFELFHNLGSYYISGLSEYNLDLTSFNKFISIKILLMFSQKRKIEVWSSTLRYIYLNSLGTHTDILTLLPDMVLLNYDSLIFLLQQSFINNYHNIIKCVNEDKLFDLFWEDSIDNFDLAAERFEESLFMSKSPFNPVSEHLKNLKSVIDTHNYYLEHVGSLDPLEGLKKTAVEIQDDYFNRLERNDFNFDPKMSYIIGDFTGKYISSIYSENELCETFNNILSNSYTEISTGRGMRDQDSNIFWGKKGHDVVFGNLQKDFKLNIEKLIEDFPKNPIQYNRLISDTEINYISKIKKSHDITLEFDMKDKEQYKGSREIYVMSENSKLLQSPVEKFFNKICKAFPNELIHKPSSIRPKFIHSKIFEHEYDDKTVMYCTMDCRKWAPRSNLWKYYFFVKGMSKFLPKNFVEYFFQFWSLMFNKKLRIQSKFVDLLITNEKYANTKDILIKRQDGDYELIMPYSFMMGMFNYLSSLMHASSQMFFCERISTRLNAECNFLAHSDDSGGIIVAKNYEICLKTYSFYEKFQRSLNHLMSRKKCCLSKRSFEIISIMYNNKRFIPMVHKFITNISFDPNGSGWYSDICNVISKVTDLYNNGGSYLQCYSMILSLGEMYRKAYHLPRSQNLSSVPIAFGGIPNLHPVHLILVGTQSQECILDLIEDEISRSKRIQTYIALTGDYSIGLASKIQYQVPFYQYHSDSLDLKDENKNKLDAISTLPYSSTLLDLMKHKNRLFDKRYVYSLTGIDVHQILTATLFYPCSVVSQNDKMFKLKDFVNTYLIAYLSEMSNIETIDISYPIGNYISYFRQTENLKIDFNKINIKSDKSCKPIRYNTLENFNLRISQENLMILSAVEKWPDIKNIFYNPERFDVIKDYLLSSIPGNDEDKGRFLKNFDPSEKEDKTRSGYLFIPSQVKIDTPSRFFTYSLLYTSRRYLISSQKPQLFTPSEFSLEMRGLECLKHKYLIFKLIEKYFSKDNFEEVCNVLKNSLLNCDLCKNSNKDRRDVDRFLNNLKRFEMRDFYSDLPFVDYITTQYRGKNIWFSNCDFNIYTNFGQIESRQVEGDIQTTWIVEDSNNLLMLWDLYRVFCDSRGIDYERPTYQDTGFNHPKLAFNDFDTPYIPNIFTMGMVLPHSRVFIKNFDRPKIYRKSNKFYTGDREIDMKIYSIYDINHSFFDSHNLKIIKNLIYDIDLVIDKDLLLKHFDNSKIYKMLLNDDRHFSTSSNKYERNGFLGQPGSFTRSLVLSDEKGLTRYRSSYKPRFITKGAIEFDTVEGVPLIDMFEKCNLMRMTLYEKISFEKSLDGKFLTAQDKDNLIKIKNKLGLEALGTAVVLYKHIFKGMMANNVVQIPKNILFDLCKLIIDSISECMASFPVNKIYRQYQGSKKGFWSIIRTIICNDLDIGVLSILLSQALIRSKSDNQYKFWSMIRDDPLLSCLTINNDYYANLNSMFVGILNVLKKNGMVRDLFYDQNSRPRYRQLALAKNHYEDIDGSYDNVNMVVFGEGEAKILNEDALDVLSAEDDLDSDMEDEIEDREWDGDNLTAFLYCNKDIKINMEETALNDFESIRLYSPTNFICYPWLGKGDYFKETIENIDFYVSSFPGRQNYPKNGLNNFKDLNTINYNEIVRSEQDDEGQLVEPTYKPRSIKNRAEAIEVFKKMGIYNEKVLDSIFPKEGNDYSKYIEYMLRDYSKFFGGNMDIKDSINKRKYGKHHLPGFQGIIEDKIIKSEVLSIFGENGHYIFTGNVNLTEKSYRYYMKMLTRIYNKCSTTDRSIILFIISILLDTVPSSSSDNWFMDSLNNIIDDIDDRINPEQDVIILPVNPKPEKLEYQEKDIFD